LSDADARPARLIYTASDPRVFQYFFMDRLRALREQGFEVACACPEQEGVEQLLAQGFDWIRIPQGRRLDPASAAVTLLLLTSEFIQRRPLLVHSHTTTVHLLTALAARAAQVPVCMATVHGHYHTGLEALTALAPIKAPLSMAYYRALGRLVDGYLVINQAEHDAVLAQGVAPPQRLHLIQGGVGVDLEHFHPEASVSQERARQRLGLPAHQRLVGFVGRLMPHKAGDLLALMDQIQAREPDVGFLVAALSRGDRALEVALEERARRGQVVLLRDRAPREMPLLYKAMDLLALPSRREGASTVLMEAAAMGLPSVAYDIPGTRDIIEDGRTGALAPVGDVGALAQACVGLLRSASLRQEAGLRARGRAQQRFSRAWAQEQVLGLYDRLLRQKLHIPEDL
jgi:glycosyltransferase involved in cell wall biosynthesis